MRSMSCFIWYVLDFICHASYASNIVLDHFLTNHLSSTTMPVVLQEFTSFSLRLKFDRKERLLYCFSEKPRRLLNGRKICSRGKSILHGKPRELFFSQFSLSIIKNYFPPNIKFYYFVTLTINQIHCNSMNEEPIFSLLAFTTLACTVAK